jgi:hypothetical protein
MFSFLKTSDNLPGVPMRIDIHGFDDIALKKLPENEWNIS